MNPLVRALVVLLALLAAGGAVAAEPAQLLVTFADRSLAHADFGQPGQRYVPSATYPASAWSERLANALAHDYQLEVSTSWPIVALGVHCVVYQVADERKLPGLLEKLGQDKRVASVQKMNRFRVMGSKSYVSLQSNLTALGIEEVHRKTLGRHVKIAIVDTGIDTAHPDLRGQVVQTQDLVLPASPNPGQEVHGTAVAGLIAARSDTDEGIDGIAPGASLISLRACWPLAPESASAECDSLTLAKALVAVLQVKPQVLNLSLTGPHDPLLSALLAQVLQQGIVVVAAEPPASDAPPGFPVDEAAVIRVATRSIDGAQAQDVFSAPGTDVLTTFPGGQYSFVSGSSFAAAEISGIVALMKELRPTITTDEIRHLLRDSARPQMLEGSLGKPSGGIVDACLAVAHLAAALDCPRETELARSSSRNPKAVPALNTDEPASPRKAASNS